MSYIENLTIIGGNTANGATDTDNPVKIGGVYNANTPNYSSGQRADLQVDANGALKINVTNGIASGNAGNANTSVLTIQGIANMTPVTISGNLIIATGANTIGNVGINTGNNTIGSVQPVPGVGGGASHFFLLAPAAPAVSNVQNTQGKVWSLHCENISANLAFLHIFDTNTTPNLGNTAANTTLPIPASNTGAGFVVPYPVGRIFTKGLFIAVTGGIANNDNTSITANSVVVDITYSS